MKNVHFVVWAVLVASSASAQVAPFTRLNQSYQPLVGATPLTFGSTDEGFAAITLPFAFPFNGASYQTVYAHVNGQLMLTLPSSCMPTAAACSTFTNLSHIPNAAGFVGNHISGYWADLMLGASTSIRVLSTPARVTIEWVDAEDFEFLGVGLFTVTFQIAIEPSGNFSIHYGPVTGSGGAGVAGYQSGALGYSVLGTGCTPTAQGSCCGSVSGSRCAVAQIVPNTLIATEPPLAPDLIASSVLVSNFQVQPSNDLSMTVAVRATNFSRTAASGWSWRAFLSTDTFRDLPDGGPGLPDGGTGANDIALTPNSTGNDLASLATQDFSLAVSTTTPPPAGDYFVLVELDSDRSVTEASEDNNLAVLPYSIVQGTDLSATAVTGVATSGPDAIDSVRLRYFNRGGVAAGSVNYRIMLAASRDAGLIVAPDGGWSVDLLPDGGEGAGPVGVRVIHRGNRVISGGETIDETVSVTMPADAPQGEFFYVLQLDPAGQTVETNKRNNVVFSDAKVDIKRADLLIESIELIDPLTRVPVRNVLFGESYRALVRFRNQGGGAARNFPIGVVISTDSTLSLLSDSLVAEQTVAQALNTDGSISVEVPFVLPVVDRVDAGLPSGNYYLFVALDTLGRVFESNKGNNTLNIGPIRAQSPAADYTVSSIQAPASAGIGEAIPLFRTLRNIGNRAGGLATYRYFASANTIVSPNDVPLEIQLSDGGTTFTGEVQLASGVAESRTEIVRLPAMMPPGTYFVGCVVDTANVVAELNEANNAFASNSVQVVQSSLRVLDVQLPDATIGRPFFYRLAAVGEEGASTWIVEADQGPTPPGLTLSSAGELTGTPSGMGGTGVRAFTVRVTNNGRVAVGRLVLRVLPSTSQVEITTAAIPAIVNSPAAALQYPLGAAGGSRPYSWRIAQGALPAGLTFNADGVLGGAPRAGTPDGVSRLTFEVRDATGGNARRELSLRLVAAGSVVIRTTRLPDAVTGQDYPPTEISVANADGSMLARPIRFSVTGNVPPGLISQEEFGVFTVSGRPTRAGTFTFTISVEDARGRTDAIDYTITVYTTRFRIIGSNLPQLLRLGDSVTASFATQPTSDVTWSIVSGRLPPGITLTPAGALEGTVEQLEAALGTFTFVVQAREASGASGLAPFALVVEQAPRRMGCSTADGGPLALLMVALLGLFGRRRFAPALVAAAVALPMVGFAQSYQASTPAPLPYQPLPSGRTAVAPTALNGVRVTLPFAFRFFGQSYTDVTMSRFGYLALAGSESAESANLTVPHNNTSTLVPQTFIAPWWDSLAVPSGTTANFAWMETGSAPNRVIVFEWRDMGTSTTTPAAQRFAFQVHLFETSNQVRFSYGPVSPPAVSASVGIQGARTVGLAGLPCTSGSNCSSTDWPGGQAIDFFLPPDLKVSRMAVDQTGYAGVRLGATAFVRNDGGRVATNVNVRFYLSTDAVLDTASDPQLGDAMAASVPAGAETPVAFPGVVPMAVTPGNYFVLAVVDPSNLIVEQEEGNNQSAPTSMTVGAPKADLAASGVTAPATAAPGGMVMISRSIANVGNAPAGAFKFTYLLSDNNVISISDRALSPVADSTGLMAGAMDAAAAMVPLPATLPSGTYWLGVCVNFDGANATSPFPLDEISVVNNCAVASAGTLITTGSLSVLTTTLPGATQYAPYGLRLRATGGTGSVSWGVTAGTLPAGLSLASDGSISGAPAVTGNFSFEATATSGTATATQMLSLSVSGGSLPLVIVDQELPGAEFARAYSASLVAVGGRPPYQWALRASSVLPDGLALSADGVLEGRATESGEKTFEVEVTDAASTKVARELRVRVVNPTTLSIGTTALVRGVLRQSYLQRLVVVGGRAPYQWVVTRFQQLPQNPTEAPGDVQMGLPQDFGLAVQDGINEDFLSGTPRRAGLFAITLLVKDGAGTEDTVSVTLQVAYTEGLAITTTVLPDAFVNQSYAVKLSHNGGRDVMPTFSLPCIRQATRADAFECLPADPKQALPTGLTLGSDGSIIGVPDPRSEVGTYTFFVKVADESGRQDIRGMSIRLQPDFASGNQGGCSSAQGLGGLAALVALAGLARRRRS